MRCVAFLFLVVCSLASAAPERQQRQHDTLHAGLTRMLQQSFANGNCTPPRSLNNTTKPFCSVPDTISLEARQFLSQTASGMTPFGQAGLFDPDPARQAELVAQLRRFVAEYGAAGSKAAEQQYMQSTRNYSFGGVPVMFAVPKGVQQTSPGDMKVLLYIHGGGYVLGSCQYQVNTPAVTAAAAGLTIVCPEYRLAPEYPFPAGLNDILTVYKAMITQGGYQPQNIVVLGDSAGGGMVLAVAIQLQREGVALPAALGMFSPWADLRNRGDTMQTLIAVDPFIGGADPYQPSGKLAGLAAIYVANNDRLADDPLASPVVADYASLFPHGSLPPTLIQVGMREVLLSDAVQLYHKMKAAAPAPGHVVISPYEGMWHVFQSYINVPEAAAASKEMAGFFTAALKGQVCK